jgi:Lon protease (S16) C-terminal proteolytic domain
VRTLSGLMALGLGAALFLTSCSSGPDIGTVNQSGTETTLTVPAMWAGNDADGNPVGGIEPAGITIDRAGPPGFRLDLATIEAQGAGAMWEAATASAAMVATLYSAVNPASISMDFTITGPIDGPSAGGILTVGLLAALRGQDLLEGVTMTGTITPEGSIGPVGLVKTKIESAVREGFTTILIPPQTQMAFDPQTEQPIDLVDFGAELGAEVIPVGTVAEAYERFTGTPFVEAGTTAYALPQPVVNATQSVAEGFLTALQQQRAKVTLSDNAASFVDEYLGRMQTRVNEGKPAEAYGIGAFIGLELARIAGGEATTADLSTTDLASAKTKARIRVEEYRGTADAQLKAAVAQRGRSLSQQLSVPTAAAWATYAIAGFDGLLANIDAVNSEDALLEVGKLANEYRFMVEQFFPDALAVIDAMPGEPMIDEAATVTFLSQYRNFLIAAGKANETYAADVLSLRVTQEGQAVIGGQLPIATQLHDIALALNPEPGQTDQELLQVAYALTYYIVTATMTANAQVYEAYDGGPAGEAVEAMQPEILRTSVITGKNIVNDAASIVSANGLDAGFPVWSSSWGVAGIEEYRDSPAQMAASWIALNEVWYDAVNVFMLNAAQQAGLGSSSE